MHWGRFLLNTIPRDRFLTPGVLGSHILLRSRRILHRNPILLHTLCPIDLIGHRWGTGVFLGMLQSLKQTFRGVSGMGVLKSRFRFLCLVDISLSGLSS